MRDLKNSHRWAPHRSKPKKKSGFAGAVLEALKELPLSRLVGLGVAAVLVLWGLWIVLAPAKIKVRRALQSMETGLEAENYWKCCALISRDFTIQGESATSQDVKGGLYTVFRDYDGFQLDLQVQSVETTRGAGTVDATFALSFWPGGAPNRMRNVQGDVRIYLKGGWFAWRFCGADIDESVIRNF